ncbi:(deoxy)nucleoside triphosphate pyrophosphohydrolase [Liquorilactobacillus cacaonum]|uniref:8-oxo-dGTP diphosphatase n=1 Tax=Liquorilactobacillus cacaonum DSM 21116 TaxID=1423729 RepID=A0A0R2CVA8_9LACO|nr:(deoxy)nucleoside triphosphate pyrophosphohydrolase [Liquorilactobacillus cacaonum]KRM92139.1 hypothetical protein FC80_GL000322 [Liquorilactobacillus cacaonum DSM 21116]
MLKKVACAVILDQDEKIFVGKRLSTILGGHWEFPGGKVKTNESILQALKREIFEELGVEVIIGQSVIEPYTYHYQFADVLLYFYFAKLKTKILRPQIYHEFFWVNQQALQKLDWLPANQRVLAKLSEWDLSKVEYDGK